MNLQSWSRKVRIQLLKTASLTKKLLCKLFYCQRSVLISFCPPLGTYIFDSTSGNAFKYSFDRAALADLFARYVLSLRNIIPNISYSARLLLSMTASILKFYGVIFRLKL